MRTREDILAEIAEVEANPPKGYASSVGRTHKLNKLFTELDRIEDEVQYNQDTHQQKLQFDDLEINIRITRKA
nr:hypothetical protein [Mammaliicoccus sp. Marseille-Q6498]